MLTPAGSGSDRHRLILLTDLLTTDVDGPGRNRTWQPHGVLLNRSNGHPGRGWMAGILLRITRLVDAWLKGPSALRFRRSHW